MKKIVYLTMFFLSGCLMADRGLSVNLKNDSDSIISVNYEYDDPFEIKVGESKDKGITNCYNIMSNGVLYQYKGVSIMPVNYVKDYSINGVFTKDKKLILYGNDLNDSIELSQGCDK